jgi:hypothetical protein
LCFINGVSGVKCRQGTGEPNARHIARESHDHDEFVAEEVVTQDNLPLSPGDKLKFFQTNAERLFGL